MRDSLEPAQALVRLPLDESLRLDREWLQDCLAWLKSTPADVRSVRLRRLADDLCANPAAKARFQHIWEQAFAPRLYAEAGIADPTSLAHELVARLKRRLLPQFVDDLAGASLAYDISSLAWSHDVPWSEVGWATLGLLATGLLNFSVSFALGLGLAVRARNLNTSGRRELIYALWKQIRLDPRRFLWQHDVGSANVEP